MACQYTIDQVAYFNNQIAVIKGIQKYGDKIKYACLTGVNGLEMWIPEEYLSEEPTSAPENLMFQQRSPHLLVVDRFYKDPDYIRHLALMQDFEADTRYYKGKRTRSRLMWPYLKEEFERLLNTQITDWMYQPANSVFQITGFNDPLVWHSDGQSYAAAIYMTPNAPITAGTSFWRDKKHHCRRAPQHPLEADRFENDEHRHAVGSEIFTGYNLLHPDNWELVDRVGAVYNRLVMWDAKIIHSASSYEGLESDVTDKARLVQLFFFNVAN